MNNGNELERNKDVVRRCIEEVWNGGRVELIAELVHGNFRGHHERNRDQDVYGIDSFRGWVESVRAAAPDLRLRVGLMLAEADRVMVHLEGSGIRVGEAESGPAAAQAVTFTATAVLRLAEGRIAESWMIYDALGVLQQLGVVAPLR